MKHSIRIHRHAAVLTVVASLFAMGALPARAATSLALFGTPLKGAARSDLRQVLIKAGLSAQRVDDHYFCDEYGVNGQLKGASRLTVCYTENDDRFASAEYTFPAFMDTQLVQRVIDTVASKYGRPGSVDGSIGLGNVTARWSMPQGMEIKVWRGWPETTTYLDLVDRSADQKMKAQMRADKDAALQKQAHKDANAF